MLIIHISGGDPFDFLNSQNAFKFLHFGVSDIWAVYLVLILLLVRLRQEVSVELQVHHDVLVVHVDPGDSEVVDVASVLRGVLRVGDLPLVTTVDKTRTDHMVTLEIFSVRIQIYLS